MIKTILVSTDGSGHAQMAVEVGADLAAKYAARLVLLHVGFRGGDVPQGWKNARSVSSNRPDGQANWPASIARGRVTSRCSSFLTE